MFPNIANIKKLSRTEVGVDVRGLQGDVNRDGKVTITDAVSVVNIILNGEASAAPAIETPDADKNPE